MVYVIKDNHSGFDMKYADKLPGTFQRLHDITELEDISVSLAFVHQVASRHVEWIWTEAKVNEGTKVFFSLPYSNHAL